MKLLGSTKSKIAKDKNRENFPYLKITEVVLIHCNDVNNIYQQNSRVFRSVIRYFTWKFYICKDVWFRTFVYWSIAYWSKLWTSRNRKQNKYYLVIN